jgi:hypothetical protein
LLYLAHVLFGEPASTSPEHALADVFRPPELSIPGPEFKLGGSLAIQSGLRPQGAIPLFGKII